MAAWRENTWGANGQAIDLPDDMSEQYNTQLSDEQEKQYTQWAKDNGRELDVQNYGLRGAWLEMQQGDMSEDARGHLGDKYKKPNHPTFSAESIYNGKEGVQGGKWEQNGNIWSYTPGRKLTKNQAKRLEKYFQENEAGNYLNLKDKVYKDPVMFMPGKTPGFFDGITDVLWKPMADAAFRFASTGLMAASKGMFWVRDDFREQMAKASEDLDDWTRANFGPDPQTMGTATMILYGLMNTLPELALFMTGAGAAARLAFNAASAGYKVRTAQLAIGSAMFGTDLGVAERNRLVNEGVDKDTAFNAGMVSGITNTIGVALPPFLGASRTMSAIYGGVSNVGINYAELKTIQYVLENQNYNELAQQYQLGLTDTIVSATLGAVMGAAFWRHPTQVKYEKAYGRLYDRYRSELSAGGKFSKEESDAQANINSRAVLSLARMAGISPDKIDDFAAKITWSEDGKSLSVPGEYLMPITQGREWRYGDNTERYADKKIKVTTLLSDDAEPPKNKGLEKIIKQYRGKDAISLVNEETGWQFTISSRDANEIVHGVSSLGRGTENRIANVAVIKRLPEVVKNAFLAESYRDLKQTQGVKPEDKTLRGIHRFYAPVVVDGQEYLTKITVKDRAIPSRKGKKESLSVYQITSVETTKTQPKGGPSVRGYDASAERSQIERNSSIGASPNNPVAPLPAGEITVRDMLTGVKRDGDVFYIQEVGADGKTHWVKDETRRTRFFEGEPNEEALAENGGYWNDPDELSQVFYQIGYHGSPYLFDAFTLAHIGSGEGGQAHGYGLYFALARMRAERYREMLAGHGYKVGGKDIGDFRRELERSANNASSAKEKKRLQERLAAFDEFYAHNNADDVKAAYDEGTITKQAYEWFKSEVQPKIKGEGHLYTVDIPNDNILLREEFSFTDQPKEVQKALRKIFEEDITFAQKAKLYRDQWYLVKTAFGRDGESWLELQGLNNALRYVNTEK